MRLVNCLVSGALVGASTTALAESHTIAEDAAAFGVREAAGQVAMSPTGKKVVILVAGAAGSTAAKVFDLESGAATIALASGSSADALRWCRFGSETVLVCKYGGNVADANLGLVSYSRLVRVDIDGKNLKSLGQRASTYDLGLRQFDGAIIDWLPGSNGSVLMERDYVPEAKKDTRISRREEGLGVDRINLETLKSEAIERPQLRVSGYMTDGRGGVRLRYQSDFDPGTGLLTGRTRLSYREAGSDIWKPLGVIDDRSSESLLPLAIDADTNSLYFLRKLNGRQALFRMALNGSNDAILVAKNDKVDIDGVTRVGRGQRVIGYTYAEENRQASYFDPEFQNLSAKLGRALPNSSIDFVDASENGNSLLIHAGSDVQPGTYYFLDRASKQMSPVADVRPNLANRKLSTMKPITYRARDGSSIPAYLTIPVGSAGKNLPTVVLPHGGPSARDEWGFDWLTQFLASRGYAVIQPNFRGSGGFGDEFENDNGFKNWQMAIDDVADAADYLVSEGIGDRSRLAIMGWSYGGYAALQSAAVSPSRYKAVIAIAPVTDLAMLKAGSEGYTNSKIVKDFVGSGDHIEQGSPLRRAAAIKSPVLLVHGDLDVNVGVTHSQRMESALRDAGVPVEFVRYPQLDHQLNESEARVEVLTKIGQLLERTIGK